MKRCKPLLGTYVEICTDDGPHTHQAVNDAFYAIEQVQNLMGFYNPASELSQINHRAHIEPVQIHPWTARVLSIAQEIHQHSQGLFNCGIGQHLVQAQLLPRHHRNESLVYGGQENLRFIDANTVSSDLPLCLDLGGIAKGFAVDIGVEILKFAQLERGFINAGGDLRVFGKDPQAIHIRNPVDPQQLIYLGEFSDAAIATSSLYFLARDHNLSSHFINPISKKYVRHSQSFSVIAKDCVYADALTKVLAISGNPYHSCLDHFAAKAIKIEAL